MPKVQFTEAEAAAVQVELEKAIKVAQDYRNRMRGWVKRAHYEGKEPDPEDLAGLDYWTNQLKILRSSLVKLRGPDGREE